MKRVKNKITTTVIVILLAVMITSITGIDVKAERSWDNKTENENVLWEKEIKKWDEAIEKWDEKRDKLHEQYYEDSYEDRAKYCNDVSECWEEDMFHLIFTSNDKNRQEMEKSRCDVNNSGLVFDDKSKWECSNSGQVIVFSNLRGEFWQSSNTGQVIEYKNAGGDYWESSNTGQVIKFEGANGEKWESSNHGQTVNYTDKDGKKWRGSDSDEADDMRWRN